MKDLKGRLVAEGTPEAVAATPGSITGECLRRVLAGGPAAPADRVALVALV